MRLILLAERGQFLSLFSSYNLYWLAALLVTVTVTSLLAVYIPSIWQKRHHNRLRLINEFLSRHQLGLCSYYAAILVTVDFLPEQKTLKLLITGSLVLSFFLALLASAWASPTHQESLLQEDHVCPAQPPTSRNTECTMKVRRTTKWKLFRNNSLLFGFSIILASVFPFWLPQEPIVDKTKLPLGSVLDAQIFMNSGTYSLDTFLDNLSGGTTSVIIDPRAAEDLHRRHITIFLHTDVKNMRLREVLDLILVPRLPDSDQWTYEVTGNTVIIRRR